MTIRYAHTNVISEDWEKLCQFYIEVFGCEPVPPQRDQKGNWLSQGTGVPNAQLKGMHLRLPGYGEQGPTLEIYQYKEILPNSIPKANRKGLGHLAFEVSDLEGVLSKVLEHGGNKLGRLVTKDLGGIGRLGFIYVTDPEGNIIELQQWS